MATKRAGTRKSKPSSKAKGTAAKPAGKGRAATAAQLHEAIENLIQAKQSGNPAAGKQATAALAAIHKRAAASRVRAAAAEAMAVDANSDLRSSMRLLGEVAAHLKPHM